MRNQKARLLIRQQKGERMAELFPCPSCGGQLIYDPESGQMKCLSCGSFFKVNEYQPQKFDNTRQVTVCPNCGGEVAAPSLDGMQFCPYCGSEIANAGHFSEDGYPKYIIPFALSKKDCISRYQKMVHGVPFLPNDLKSTEGLSSFVGLYTPYWIYDYKANGSVNAPVEKFSSDAFYDYHYTADMTVNLYCDIHLGQDASKTLDDTVSAQIEPFFYEKLIAFHPNYMAGFYAENSTVDPSIYEDSMKERCADMIAARIDQAASSNGSYSLCSRDNVKNRLLSCTKRAGEGNGAYLPIWFLTTRKNDRVAYTVVNGQTGAAHADLPIDIRQYLIASLLASAVCAFVLLLLFGVFGTVDMKAVPYLTLLFSSILTMIASRQSEKIYRKEHHLDDPGYTGERREGKKTSSPGKPKSMRTIMPLLIFIILFIVVFSMGFPDSIIKIGAVVFFAVSVISMIRRARGSSAVTAALSLAGSVLSLLDIAIAPYQDIFMYGLMIVNLLVLLAVAVRLTKDYNRIATNPLPQFQKTGGRLNERY